MSEKHLNVKGCPKIKTFQRFYVNKWVPRDLYIMQRFLKHSYIPFIAMVDMKKHNLKRFRDPKVVVLPLQELFGAFIFRVYLSICLLRGSARDQSSFSCAWCVQRKTGKTERGDIVLCPTLLLGAALGYYTPSDHHKFRDHWEGRGREIHAFSQDCFHTIQWLHNVGARRWKQTFVSPLGVAVRANIGFKGFSKTWERFKTVEIQNTIPKARKHQLKTIQRKITIQT